MAKRASLGVTEKQKGAIAEGIVGLVLGLGGYAALQQGSPSTAEKVIGYGLAGAGGLLLLDALGVDVLKGIGLK